MMLTAPLLTFPKPLIDDFPAMVLANTVLGNDVYLLSLKLTQGLHQQQAFGCLAGQFFMLEIAPADETSSHCLSFDFRRPFSPLLFDASTQQLQIYYKVVGEGTRRMSYLAAGSTVQIMAPLGNAIGEGVNPAKTLLVGGGVGVAPLVYWASQQKAMGLPVPPLIWGSRFGPDLQALLPQLTDIFTEHQLFLASDDGIVGEKGTVIDLIKHHQSMWAETVETIIVCGPTPMMKACVAYFAQAFPTARVLVSLENHMPCGTGACFGCVVENANPTGLPLRVCYEGPVFEASQLVWEAKPSCHH
jgi:dihydroorotate dehydrogenase electron transfer subunit